MKIIAAIVLAASLGFAAGRLTAPTASKANPVQPVYEASHVMQAAIKNGVTPVDYSRYMVDFDAKLQMAKQAPKLTPEQRKAIEAYEKAYRSLNDAHAVWNDWISTSRNLRYAPPTEILQRYGMKPNTLTLEDQLSNIWAFSEKDLANGDSWAK